MAGGGVMPGWPTLALVGWALLSLAAGIVWSRHRSAARRPNLDDLQRVREREASDRALTYGDVPFLTEGEHDV